MNRLLNYSIPILSVIFFISAYFSEGYLHPDEHWQIIEFASWKLGNISTETLPWEFGRRLRPTFQPTLFYLMDHLMLFGVGEVNPFRVAFLMRLITAVFSLITLVILLRETKKLVSEKTHYQNWYHFLLFFFWFFPLIGVRYSSEMWSANFATLALILIISIFKLEENNVLSKMTNGLSLSMSTLNNKKYFLSGILFGFAFLCRYQTGIIFFGLVCWLIFIQFNRVFINHLTKILVAMVGGFALIFLLGIVIDRWFYGEWVVTAFNYFWINLVEGKASSFGVSPFYYYFFRLQKYFITPFSYIITTAILLFFVFFPKHLLTWTMGLFILAHSLIPHKEYRFLIPVVWFFPFMFIQSWEQITTRFPLFLFLKHKYFLSVFISINGLLLMLLLFRPYSNSTLFEKWFYNYVSKHSDKKIHLAAKDKIHYHDFAGRPRADWYYRQMEYEFYKVNKVEERKLFFKRIQAEASEEELFLIFIDNDDLNPEYLNQGELKLILEYPPRFVKNIKYYIEKINIFDWFGIPLGLKGFDTMYLYRLNPKN